MRDARSFSHLVTKAIAIPANGRQEGPFLLQSVEIFMSLSAENSARLRKNPQA
jgi:hypothetical protein